MKIKFFVKQNCPNCPPAKKLAEKLINDKVNVEVFDLGTTEGLTESVFHCIMSTPTVILADDKNEEIKSWRGQAPQEEELRQLLK